MAFIAGVDGGVDEVTRGTCEVRVTGVLVE
jgi:hypothetical protein